MDGYRNSDQARPSPEQSCIASNLRADAADCPTRRIVTKDHSATARLPRIPGRPFLLPTEVAQTCASGVILHRTRDKLLILRRSTVPRRRKACCANLRKLRKPSLRAELAPDSLQSHLRVGNESSL